MTCGVSLLFRLITVFSFLTFVLLLGTLNIRAYFVFVNINEVPTLRASARSAAKSTSAEDPDEIESFRSFDYITQ